MYKQDRPYFYLTRTQFIIIYLLYCRWYFLDINQRAASSGTKPIPGEKDIKDIFIKITSISQNNTDGKQTMSDELLFHFLGNTLELADDDPFIGYILVSLMKIKKMEEVTFDEFKGVFAESK